MMRYLLLSIIIVLCAASSSVAAEYYVNGATGNNAADTSSWGVSSDSPFASLTCAVNFVGASAIGTSSNHDTIYFYGINANVADTAYYWYNDNIYQTDKYFDIVGVSCWSDWRDSQSFRTVCDSPVIRGDTDGSSNLVPYIRLGGASSSVIDGIYFSGIYMAIMDYGGSGSVYRNNVFDSCGQSNGGILPYATVYLSDQTNGAFRYWYFYNNSFVNNRVCNIGFEGGASNTDMVLWIDHNSMVNDTLSLGFTSLNNTCSYTVNITNSIIGSDTLWYSSATVGEGIVIDMTNCDTFGQTTLATQYGVTPYTLPSASCVNSDPIYNLTTWQDNGWMCKYADQTIGTGGSDGLPIGLIWSYTAPITTARRPRLTMSQWLQIIGSGF